MAKPGCSKASFMLYLSLLINFLFILRLVTFFSAQFWIQTVPEAKNGIHQSQIIDCFQYKSSRFLGLQNVWFGGDDFHVHWDTLAVPIHCGDNKRAREYKLSLPIVQRDSVEIVDTPVLLFERERGGLGHSNPYHIFRWGTVPVYIYATITNLVGKKFLLVLDDDFVVTPVHQSLLDVFPQAEMKKLTDFTKQTTIFKEIYFVGNFDIGPDPCFYSPQFLNPSWEFLGASDLVLKHHGQDRTFPDDPRDCHITLILRGNTTRRFLNQDEILERFDQEGFHYDSVLLEKLPVVDQIRLMRKTQILVGMHGAGLMGMAFLPPGAATIEIFPYSFSSTCYFNTARLMGRPYFPLLCDDPTRWRPSPFSEEFKQSDLVVDTDALVQLVKQAMALQHNPFPVVNPPS